MKLSKRDVWLEIDIDWYTLDELQELYTAGIIVDKEWDPPEFTIDPADWTEIELIFNEPCKKYTVVVTLKKPTHKFKKIHVLV